MAEFTLDVRDMPEGVSEHGFRVRKEWLAEQLSDLEGIAAGEGEGIIALEATRQGKQVLLHGTLRAPLTLTCVRCLQCFQAEARAAIDVIMKPGTSWGRETEEELGIDELNEELYEGETIVLDGLVRDLAVLEVPMNPSCGDACPGWDSLTAQANKG